MSSAIDMGEVIEATAKELGRYVTSQWPYGDKGVGGEALILLALARVLRPHGFLCYPEVAYPRGGRVDVLAIGPRRAAMAFELKLVGTPRGEQPGLARNVASDLARLRKKGLSLAPAGKLAIQARVALVGSWNQTWTDR